jgi:DNA-binding beta-propeller fold protein YncE
MRTSPTVGGEDPAMTMRLLLCLSTLLLSTAAAAERLVLVAGGGDGGEGGEGVQAAAARLDQPFAIAFAGAIAYTAEEHGNRVRRIAADGTITTIVGTGAKGDSGLGGPGAQALVNGPHHLLPMSDGALLIADTYNFRVLRYDPATGVVAAFAGTGRKGFAGDGGPAVVAQCGNAYCLAPSLDGGRVYLADIDSRRIRAIDVRTGVMSTVAGNGQKGAPADGAKAVDAPLLDPRAVAVDSQDRLYILERGGHCLRVVERDGTIRTVAGSGQKGDSGDGGDARQATFNGPKHLFVDRDDSVLIADTENHVIRRYTPKDGRVVRIAGTGKAGKGDPGAPLETALDRPHGVQIGPDGALYIADSNNNRILKLVRE